MLPSISIPDALELKCLKTTVVLIKRRVAFDDTGGFCQFGGSLELALGANDLGPALAPGFSLPRNGSLHLLGQIDLLKLNRGDLEAPGFRVGVEDLLQFGVDLFALEQQVVEFCLAS
jgi:hypothetical protein